jgi:hypothetical protein
MGLILFVIAIGLAYLFRAIVMKIEKDNKLPPSDFLN